MMASNLLETLRIYWTPFNFFCYAIIANLIINLWDLYLHYRQHRIYMKEHRIPAELIPYVEEENFTKARLYNLDKSNFGFIRQIFSSVQKFVTTYIFLAAILWNVSTRWSNKLLGYDNEIAATILFFILQSTLSTLIDLPFSLYSNFVIEERHGFNKYTLKFFMWDTLKKFLVFQPITSLIIGASTYIIIRYEQNFFFYLWLFSSAMIFVFMVIYPSLIAPIFDKYIPLEKGSLRSRIETLAEDIKFPLKNIYVVDGSKRSNHSNAYFYGIFKSKQIVLFDTLFDKDSPHYLKKESSKEDPQVDEPGEELPQESEGTQLRHRKVEKTEKKEKDEKQTEKQKKSGCTELEIVAIICHELGHWHYNHIFKNVAISLINLFFIFKISAYFYKDEVIYSAFGFTGSNNPCFIGLAIIIENIFLVYFEFFNFSMSIISRKFEFQADDFAKKLNFRTELINALVKLNKDNLGYPVYDWLYSALLHSHPPILDRINALRKID